MLSSISDYKILVIKLFLCFNDIYIFSKKKKLYWFYEQSEEIILELSMVVAEAIYRMENFHPIIDELG